MPVFIKGAGGSIISGIVNQYVVQSGSNVSAGDFVQFANNLTTTGKGTEKVFNAATTFRIQALTLSETNVLLVYVDQGTGYNIGTAMVVSISGTTVTTGTEYTFDTYANIIFSLLKISNTQACVVYANTNNYGSAIVLTVSGTTISFGTPLMFKSTAMSYLSAALLSSTKVLVACGTYSALIVLTISGTTITAGTALPDINLQSMPYTSLVALSGTKAMLTYADTANSNYGTAIPITISGTTITAGAARIFNAATTEHISSIAIGGDVLITYRDVGNSGYGTAQLLSTGFEYVFNAAATSDIFVFVLSDSKILIAYADNANSSYGTAILAEVNGGSITFGAEYVFNTGSTGFISIALLSDTNLLTVYRDGGNNLYGSGVVITLASQYVSPAIDRYKIIGVARTSGAAGTTINVSTI